MSRRGISLIEVLMSIGVVSVGLLGVVLLLPVAYHQAESGARTDRKALVSKRAYREFNVLDMGNPLRWMDPWDNAPFEPAEMVDPTLPGNPRRAFCIDPIWVAANNGIVDPITVEANGIPDPTTAPWWNTFPAAPRNLTNADLQKYGYAANESDVTGIKLNVQPLMHRITLGAPITGLMSKSHADELFVAQDDLQFEIPKEKTAPPAQVILADTTNFPLKRAAQGNFSWLATLVPENGFSDLYKLSIVVFYQRNLADRQVNIRVISPQLGVGFAGGEIVLQESLDAKVGEYVMLSRNKVLPAGDVQTNFQWYRIATLNGTNMTLHGMDWDFSPNIDPQGTYLTYVPGITSVFEKTIRLQTSTLWSN